MSGAASPLRVMIVDDEALAREGLRLRLRREPDVLVLGEFPSAALALEAMRAERPDVLFLDVQMPEVDGFALLRHAAGGPLPLVVFVTAHDRYALRAFGVEALDYLLKPVEQARLREALDRARRQLALEAKGEVADQVRALLARTGPAADAAEPAVAPAPDARAARIAVRRDGVVRLVDPARIDFVDAAGDNVRVHVAGVAHVVHRSMGEMLALLDPARFARIHRSTIVNLDRVKELQPHSHGEYVVVLHDGTRLKLSRGQRAAVARALGLRAGR
jgi:two-component system, LytTR family, response regulator